MMGPGLVQRWGQKPEGEGIQDGGKERNQSHYRWKPFSSSSVKGKKEWCSSWSEGVWVEKVERNSTIGLMLMGKDPIEKVEDSGVRREDCWNDVLELLREDAQRRRFPMLVWVHCHLTHTNRKECRVYGIRPGQHWKELFPNLMTKFWEPIPLSESIQQCPRGLFINMPWSN